MAASLQDIYVALTSIAQQLAALNQSQANGLPAPLTGTGSSPKFTGISVTTTTSVVVSSNALRHGIVFHNPGVIDVYVYPTAQAIAGSSVPAGSIRIVATGTFTFPSPQYPNNNIGWSAISSATGAAITAVEFF
jgi:hypothetical protein